MLTRTVLFAAVAVIAVSGTDLDARIIGGDEAGKYEARYLAQIYDKVTYANGTIRQWLVGTGAFVSGRSVVTSASIFQKGHTYMVYYGTNNNVVGGHLGIQVVKILRPPNCDVERRVNNLALLILDTKLTECVYCRDVEFLEIQTLPLQDNSFLQTVGFGSIEHPCYRGQQTSTHLRKTDMTVLSDHKCKRLTENASKKGRLICTRPNNYVSTVCSGDEGAPLVDLTYRRLVGVLNFGDEYCADGAPVVYTAIAPYAMWLNKNIVY